MWPSKPNKEATEEEVLKGCLSRDRACQKAVFDRYSGRMLSLCFRYSRDKMEAEDILQEAFIRVFDSLHQFGFKGSFEGWLRRVMVTTALNHYRKKKNERMEVDMEEAVEVEKAEFDNYDNRFELKELMAMVQTLPAQYKAVFNLYAVDGYNHREIAEMLGISESSSKSNLSRARGILQRMITEKHNYIHGKLQQN
ncbi:MAG: sigma-70 family RNA polymerase sigma factor [Flavobacteriaceae bacterium]|nr:sigma-70 family RNA polymerase sigma factor [Flavobacteriaceae bacterium]